MSYLLLFFLVIELQFLIPVAIAQILNPIGELVIPIGIPSKEAKTEIEVHPVFVEAIVVETIKYVI